MSEESQHLSKQNRLLSEEIKRLKNDLAYTKESIVCSKKIQKSLKCELEILDQNHQTEVKIINNQLYKAKQRTETLVQQNRTLSCQKEQDKKIVDDLKNKLKQAKLKIEKQDKAYRALKTNIRRIVSDV